MNKNKLSIILASIGIILVCILMIMSTYAYFTINVDGDGKDIELTTFDKNTTIVYKDTSNVSMVNAYTGDEIVKTFSIENTSNYNLYYDIYLKNVVNNFETKSDLVYTLNSNDAGYREESIIPSKDDKIASQILIKPFTKHDYELKITFKKTNYDQNNNMNKTFSSNIFVTGSNINVNESIYKSNTILEHMITRVTNNSDNGIFKTNNSISGIPVYYYKGSNVNNNLVYNNMCFKIIRTDENYGIRIIYTGEYVENKCVNKPIEVSSFNTKSNYNAYVGYMYGNASSNNYKNEHNNVNDSNIKHIIEDWYKEESFNNISNNSIFCNSRKTNLFRLNGVLFGLSGYGNQNSGYNDINTMIKSYDCINIEDRFSVNNEESNKKLVYPVSLITLDEILYSGKNSYLYNFNNYWTLTPAYFNGSDAYVYAVGNKKISINKVTDKLNIYPVLSLDKDTIILSGDGTDDSPFRID